MKWLECPAIVFTSMVAFLLVIVNSSQAQFHYNFENISTDQGLSDGWVRSIIQDPKGFLWLGTARGLERFDGYKFKNFLDHGITSLHQDKSGNIWLVSDVGLEMFDPTTETLVSFTKQIDSLKLSRRMRSITEDKNGNFWISSLTYHENSGGLIFFNRKTKQFRKYSDGDMDNIWCSLIDEYGNIWVGGYGISILDPEKETFIAHIYADTNKVNSLSGIDIPGLYKEKDGTIWAATSRGVSRISYSNKYAMNYENFRKDPATPNSLVDNTTNAITKDSKGNIWIATNAGVSRYNPLKREFKNFVASTASPNSLKESLSNVIFQDKNGTIWIGHYNLGLSKIKSNKGFIQLTNEPGRKESLAGNNTAAVYSDKEGVVWLSVVDHGVYKIDFHGDYNQYPSVKIYPHPSGRISAIIKDRNRNIWIGGEEDQALHVFKNEMNGQTVVSDFRKIYSFVEDYKKDLWVLDEGMGVFKTENGSGLWSSFVHLLPDTSLTIYSTLNFSGLLEDRKKRVWVTTWEGEIYSYDTLAKRFFRPEIRTSLPFNYDKATISTLKDAQGDYLWVGTMQGLCKYKIEKDLAKGVKLILEEVISEKEGLTKNGKSNLYTAALEEDTNGNIWLAQGSGLYKLNTRDNTLRLYGTEDGLVGNTFAFHASCKLQNGFLAFGTTGGLAVFHPDSLKDNSTIPNIAFTDFQLSNQSVPIGKPKEDSTKMNFSLAQAITYTKEIVLPYDEKILGFEFVALDFTAPEKNQYAYQMIGFDKDWVYSGTRRLATYTNLHAGHYTFRIKGSNNDGYWNEAGASIRVIILPPPWKTWWAYTGYGLIFVFLLVVARQEIVKRERLRNQFKLKELEASKYQELDTLKSRFFGNISHEFRTPLTLILGPLQKRLDRSTDEEDKVELSVMQRNAVRLLNLVNQLLDLSRLEAGMLKLKCARGDLGQFVTAIASQFSSIASSKHIHFQVHQEEDFALYFDPDKVNKMITNLLSNAFKFTPEGGAIQVIIRKGEPDSRYKEGFAEIVVTDNGQGIKPEQISKIFDRFYQADNSTTREYEGSGIGLALTKELVELHRGEVNATSISGQGSEFTLRLPLGKSHLNPAELVDSETAIEINPTDEKTIRRPSDGVGAAAANEQDDGHPPRILIVEDNADLRYYLRENMKHHFHILEAEDGEKGISIALKEVPDLIISDLMMPKVNGLQLCHQLKEDERTSHIPIILLTAKADVETRIEGFQTGADDYIAKPFDFQELESRINNLIEIRRKLQAKFDRQLALKPKEIKGISIDDRFLKKIMEIVEANMSDTLFSVDRLALEAAMSSVQLYRKLKALTGHGPNEFIRHFRLERAASLLHQQAGSVADIAYQVGFNSLSYFSKCFKEKFGKTPSEY